VLIIELLKHIFVLAISFLISKVLRMKLNNHDFFVTKKSIFTDVLYIQKENKIIVRITYILNVPENH